MNVNSLPFVNALCPSLLLIVAGLWFVVAKAIPRTATSTSGTHLRTVETCATTPEALTDRTFSVTKTTTTPTAVRACPQRGTSETVNFCVRDANVPIRISDPKNPNTTTSSPM